MKFRDFELTRTKINGFVMTYTTIGVDGALIRVLNIDHAYQSATYLDERRFTAPFAYLRTYEEQFEPGFPIHRVLMIGGGGYAYPKHILSHHDNISIDVVEIDPKLTKLAMRRFFLDEALERYPDRLRCITSDGLTYLENTNSKAYDTILNDAFRGQVPDADLMSDEGLREVHRCLKDGGMYFTNVVVRNTNQGAFDLMAIMSNMQNVFRHVHIIPARDTRSAGGNYLLVGTDSEVSFSGEITI
ncbi:MAG: fused MFS/spermidine synthase [Eggerthellaceae bacterium]|nr:fused MFS/spermidine synthase [Eggerthellaceae bacterium]